MKARNLKRKIVWIAWCLARGLNKDIRADFQFGGEFGAFQFTRDELWFATSNPDLDVIELAVDFENFGRYLGLEIRWERFDEEGIGGGSSIASLGVDGEGDALSDEVGKKVSFGDLEVVIFVL